MINPTLSLLKLLSQNNFGKIDQTLFWEKLGIDKDGIYISSIGEAQDLHGRRSQSYQLMSRASNDMEAYEKLAQVVEFINNSYSVCELPKVQSKSGKTLAEAIGNVSLMKVSTISNGGLDSNSRVVWTATGRIEY